MQNENIRISGEIFCIPVMIFTVCGMYRLSQEIGKRILAVMIELLKVMKGGIFASISFPVLKSFMEFLFLCVSFVISILSFYFWVQQRKKKIQLI